ncbi:MAG: MacB family efflux pump subunit [Campylobacter sp.]
MIKLENVSKTFQFGENEICALKNINLTIQKGEFVAIMGQSGSGKSTLMNILGALDTPSSGSYFIDGREISRFDLDELAILRSKKFGFVFQRYNLISTLNSMQNVALSAVYAGVEKSVREAKANEILSDLGLGDKTQNLPNKLSGGQQQRVSIARALINGGEIILADEPTGALDSKSGIKVMEIIKNLHEKGHTIILVTHDSNIAEWANRVIEIKDGEILSDTKKSELKFELKEQNLPQKREFSANFDRFKESFKMSISSIFAHKLRSILTMLGIIIGVMSVICVIALGKGSQEQIMSSIKRIGTNTIEIFPGSGFGDMRSGRIKTLTRDDASYLAKQNFLDYSTPNTNTSGVITYANKNINGSLRGGGKDSLAVNGITLQSGRTFSADDIENSRAVVIIDQNAKNELFADENPIGKTIFFNRRPLSIIGVAAPSDAFGISENVRIYAPYTSVINNITGDRYIHSITVKVKDDIDTQLAEERVKSALSQKHGKSDFFTFNSDTIKQTIESTTQTMQLLIASIAAISLIVGGIGVMNIMLVSVTERTKEIGIRMAIGARKSDIMQQFLIEAVLLCVLSGIIGVILAFFAGEIFNWLNLDFVMRFSVAPVVLSLVASSAIGIIFGYIPALRASKLNPIDALLQE